LSMFCPRCHSMMDLPDANSNMHCSFCSYDKTASGSRPTVSESLPPPSDHRLLSTLLHVNFILGQMRKVRCLRHEPSQLARRI
jgi:DNA-directed RNA polymerase subunit M/transcription elongation factor TFIIS